MLRLSTESTWHLVVTLVSLLSCVHTAWSDTDTRETLSHWSVNLAVHTAVTLVRYGRTTETHWSVDLAVHTAVKLVR